MVEAAELTWSQATALDGKRVVVTGCASGIGRATANQFAGAGAVVYGGDINERDGRSAIEEIRAAGGAAEFIALDLSQPPSIDAFVDSVKQRSGDAIDVIASVAGWERVGPFLENTPAFW